MKAAHKKRPELRFTVIDLTPAPRCSDYDDECKDVISPADCWTGTGFCTQMDVADGYCPLMYAED